jgi:M6 family metalloprotease-like protein
MKTTKQLLTVILLSLIMVFVFSASSTVFAITACPDPIPFTQPDGILVVVYGFGDEFLNWYEDANGNLVVFDEDKKGYCYAEWTDDGVVSTGELIGDGLAAALNRPGTSKHIIPQAVIDRAMATRETEMAAFNATIANLAELAALPVGTLPVYTPVKLMERKMLIIHVTWEDRSNLTIATNGTGALMPKLTGKQIYDLNFGLKGEVARSVNGYFQNLLMADGPVILPAQVNDPLDGYQGVVEVMLPGRNPNPRNTGQGTIMQNALTQACRNGQIELSQFDTDKNGNLATAELAIGFIVDGWESAIGSNSPSFWGVSTSGTPAASATNGVKVASFFGQGAYHRRTGNIPNDMLTTGIIAHEMGHSGYSFSDTYDYGTLTGSNTTCGQGYWSLQTQGSWARKTGENSGATPGYQDAYNLVRSGFVTPGVANIGESGVMDNHLDIYIAQTPIITPYIAAPATHPYGTRYGGQYFLLQQRKFGNVDNYDQGAFGSISSAANVSTGGILIFHVDAAVTLTRINDKPGHFRAAIEEAHGVFSSMQQRSGMVAPGATRNNGDLNDIWGVAKTEFSHRSDPGSGTYLYDDGRAWVSTLNPVPHQNTPSGVVFTEILWDRTTLTTSFLRGFRPVIDVHPQGTTVFSGTAHEMKVAAHSLDGGDISYQWYCNGLAIPGATADTYRTINIVYGIHDYYVIVTNTITDVLDGQRRSTTAISNTATVEVLPTYEVYLSPGQTDAKPGDILLVDVMMVGNINYTQMTAEIAYDSELLELESFANLLGWAASVTSAPNIISLRSVPSMNMVAGGQCSSDTQIVTLKFLVKDSFTEDSINTGISFASVLVSPPGGVTGSTTSPGKPVIFTLNKLTPDDDLLTEILE